MKVRWLVGALVVLVIMNLAALGAFLFAYLHGPPDHGWRAGRPWAMHHWVARQNPEEQRKLFRAMRSFHEEVVPLIESTDQLEGDLIASMGADPVSQAHVDSLLEQISRNRLEIAQRATRRMIALGDSLSSEEREHLMEMLVRMQRAPIGPGFGPHLPPDIPLHEHR